MWESKNTLGIRGTGGKPDRRMSLFIDNVLLNSQMVVLNLFNFSVEGSYGKKDVLVQRPDGLKVGTS